MPRRFTLFIVLSALCFYVCSGEVLVESLLAQPSSDSSEAAVIQVTVRGVRNSEGHVLLSLFASSEGFPDDPDKAVHRMESPIDADSVTLTMTGIPPGRYACSALHDKNDNRKMDKEFFGIPKEGYAFSRNARGRFGPPGFDKAAFDVAGDTVTIVIDLVYH